MSQQQHTDEGHGVYYQEKANIPPPPPILEVWAVSEIK